jgi:hypothetical protein
VRRKAHKHEEDEDSNMAIQHHPPKRRMLPRGKRRPQLKGCAEVSEICVESYLQAIAFHASRSYGEAMPTVAHIRGLVGGAVILTLFGSFWCIIVLASWRARPVGPFRRGLW